MSKPVMISAAAIDAEVYHNNGVIVIQDYLTPESVEFRNDEGSHIDVLIEATGWQPYTHVVMSEAAGEERLLLAHLA